MISARGRRRTGQLRTGRARRWVRLSLLAVAAVAVRPACGSGALASIWPGAWAGAWAGGASVLHAQTPRVVVQTNQGIELNTVSPAFTVRAFGFGTARPLRVTLRVSESFGVTAPFLVDTVLAIADSTVTIASQRALPSGATVYWRALVESGAQAAISEITGPRVVPPWVTLIEPASSGGDHLVDVRQPRFVWRSPPVDSGPGPWRYELTINVNGQSAFATAGMTDTTLRVPSPLQANTSYRWSVTATLAGAPGAVTASSPGSFVITDPLLPTSTILFQNFPNPFPSAASFNTCFWFDIGEPGGTVSLDILDLRGNPVQRIVPAEDGQSLFPAGRYGRGAPGTGSNCNNRFVWDGRSSDGRTVPPGVYLARFRAEGSAPTIRRILFRGR